MTDRAVPGFTYSEAGPSSAPSSVASSPALTSSPALGGGAAPRKAPSQGRLAKFLLPGRSRSSSTASVESTVAASLDEATASGRVTPEQKRRSHKAAAASLLANDARYKKFAAQVDRALQSFESVNEWADFISFLSRLLKTLQAPSPAFQEIPRKLVVAKRLAQCLNPALPSGVHQRALDVYALIFNTIGEDGLRRDLLIWSSGLFPFFQYAATSVRPNLLAIYETYYLPLGETLRPAMKAFVMALLPGMEEETGDFFDRVLSILTRLSETLPDFFLQTVFLIMISSSSNRLAALNYLSRRLTQPMESEPSALDGLITRGVAAVLGDENALVKRYGLDLLLRAVPMDGSVYRNAESKDQDLLLRAAFAVILQRDLSLSRRVYTWLLGSAESHDEQIVYFTKNGLQPLVAILQHDMANLDSHSGDRFRAFKTFLASLDKWEIGAPLAEHLSVPALRSIFVALSSPAAEREELLGTAIAIYEAVEPLIVWRQISALAKAFVETGSQVSINDTAAEKKDMFVHWFLTTLRHQDEEVLGIFIPAVLQFLLDSITISKASTYQVLDLCLTLLKLIPTSMLAKIPPGVPRLSTMLCDQAFVPHPPIDLASRQGTIASIFDCVFALCVDVARQRTSESIFPAVAMCSYLLESETPLIETLEIDRWVEALRQALEMNPPFLVVDKLTSAILQASRSSVPNTSSYLPVIDTVMRVLLHHLGPRAAVYHCRALELLWEYNQLAEVHTLEDVLCRRLSDVHCRAAAFQEFGTLWRLTDESMLPGEIFFSPIFIVLDAVKSPDPMLQRQAETWLRVNLKSYFRLLDPIIARLLAMPRDKPCDLSHMFHLTETVGTLLRFGGQALSKACQSTEITKSPHPAINIQRFPTYLDLMMDLLTRNLTVTPYPPNPTQTNLALRLANASLEVLQLLIAFGHVSHSSVEGLEQALVAKIADSIRVAELSLQSKMLHLLHAAMASASGSVKSHRRSVSLTSGEKLDLTDNLDIDIVALVESGISNHRNLPVLQHWVDFILMAGPNFQHRRDYLERLSASLDQQLRRQILHLRDQFAGPAVLAYSITELEPIMLLSASERIISLILARAADRKSEDGKAVEGSGGLLGIMSGVFSVEGPAADSKMDSLQWLDNATHALLVIWTITADTTSSGPTGPSKLQAFSRVRSRARKVFEKLFKGQPAATLGSIIRIWSLQSDEISDEAIFDAVDGLTPSAQRVVEMIGESVVGKNKPADHSSDALYTSFLEAYILRLEAPIAVQVWTSTFNLARDVMSAAITPLAKAQLWTTLRCLTALGRIVAATSALEDRRLRRDLQETYARMLDLVMSNLSKLGEVPMWERNSKAVNGESEKVDLTEEAGQNLTSINLYIAKDIVPSLRSLLVDADRVAVACSSIANGALVTSFRQHRIDSSLLAIIAEMTHLPSAARAWRPLVGDYFNDARFFRLSPTAALAWEPLICSMMDTDKDRFADLLSRIQPGPSGNIFVNKETDMLTRSLTLRRLSYTLLAGDLNHYLAHLPSIQEKLVDIIRNEVVTPRVHGEVYLCLRVMMTRISAQHLNNFWPVILAELLKEFEMTMDDPPLDGDERLQLVLAACKFLDLLLVIQSEDFQVHEWIFVTDTTDAAFPPDRYDPESIMDRLNEIVLDSRAGKGRRMEYPALELDLSDSPEAGEMRGETMLRRPRLGGVSSIQSLAQLQPFFARASIDTFEGVYGGAGVDWDGVENGLRAELFEGRE